MTIPYDDGTYVGAVQNGVPSGFGQFTDDTGIEQTAYTGEWKSGRMHGRGVFTKSSALSEEGYSHLVALRLTESESVNGEFQNGRFAGGRISKASRVDVDIDFKDVDIDFKDLGIKPPDLATSFHYEIATDLDATLREDGMYDVRGRQQVVTDSGEPLPPVGNPSVNMSHLTAKFEGRAVLPGLDVSRISPLLAKPDGTPTDGAYLVELAAAPSPNVKPLPLDGTVEIPFGYHLNRVAVLRYNINVDGNGVRTMSNIEMVSSAKGWDDKLFEAARYGFPGNYEPVDDFDTLFDIVYYYHLRSFNTIKDISSVLGQTPRFEWVVVQRGKSMVMYPRGSKGAADAAQDPSALEFDRRVDELYKKRIDYLAEKKAKKEAEEEWVTRWNQYVDAMQEPVTGFWFANWFLNEIGVENRPKINENPYWRRPCDGYEAARLCMKKADWEVLQPMLDNPMYRRFKMLSKPAYLLFILWVVVQMVRANRRREPVNTNRLETEPGRPPASPPRRPRTRSQGIGVCVDDVVNRFLAERCVVSQSVQKGR